MSKRHEPLGVIETGGRRFWFSIAYGWEHESYELVDLASTTFAPVLSVSGGGC